MWYDESTVYQIYPLGFCGAEAENPALPGTEDLFQCAEGTRTENHRILHVLDMISHIKACGFDTVLFNPLFESDRHGYDTRNFRLVDRRLGSNDDFKKVCKALHENGIRVLLDGVFNHVGRGFFAFQDVLKNREQSPYKNFFHINFQGNDNYNDGLWYEGWEGHFELVKLNLHEPKVRRYLFDAIQFWYDSFGIDGLRLDVAYCLDEGFLRELHQFAKNLQPDFFLLGEILHGDYNRIVNADMLDSCTNYECYKGLYSSFNSMNLFEIGYSLNRQFGPEQWTLYKGKHLLSFADNHDVSRLASILQNPAHIKPAYGLLFGMPGIPAVYYGSEWGIKGDKADGDAALRPAVEQPVENELTDWIKALCIAHKGSKALCYGSYRQLLITNHQLVFEREADGERVIVAVNAAGENYTAHFDARCGRGTDLITGEAHDFGSGSVLAPYSTAYWRTES